MPISELSFILLIFCGGVACGGIGVWIFKVHRLLKLQIHQQAEYEQQRVCIHDLESKLKEKQVAYDLLQTGYETRLDDMRVNFDARMIEQKAHTSSMLQALQSQYASSLEKNEQQKEQLKEELKTSFKVLSADILRIQTQSFNQNQILSLQPLKEEIERFSKQLCENHTVALTNNTALKTQIEQLNRLNLQLSQDAHNLTNALKGENKIQGNWGEVILARVLETSGLQEGREYEMQVNMKDDENKILRPDVVIKLPKSGGEERCVVVDSKTSLISYERLCNAQNEQERKKAQRELINSIQVHVTSLNTKAYQQYLQGCKLDFVLMFIPIEGAFLEAMHGDSSLYDRAYQKGVVLVSPTTIMAVLKIIHNLWQLEYRNSNMDKIFTEIYKLFKGIEGFESTLEKLGNNISMMGKTYENMMTKYNGRRGIKPKSSEIRRLLHGAGVEEIEEGDETKTLE